MPKKQSKQKNTEVEAGMKVLLEIERFSEASEVKRRVSLGSYVEEVLPDGHFLIQMPIHRGHHYPLQRNNAIQMYLFAKSRIFSTAVLFVEQLERDDLMFAKMRRLGDIKADQRRDCYRLQCIMPVMVERDTDGKAEPPPPLECRVVNLSDGGALFNTNEDFHIHEKITLSFDIGTAETVEAEVVRLDRTEDKALFRYKVAVIFNYKGKKQKDRIYRYIVEQQRKRRKTALKLTEK